LEIIERLQQLKVFIEKHNISVYEKKADRLIKKIFDLWDNNNTVKIDGEPSLLKEEVERVMSKSKQHREKDNDYFRKIKL
jgi:hypothetical protein